MAIWQWNLKNFKDKDSLTIQIEVVWGERGVKVASEVSHQILNAKMKLNDIYRVFREKNYNPRFWYAAIL